MVQSGMRQSNRKHSAFSDFDTNAAERVSGLFKHSVVGAYHQVSAKHLDNYLNEFEWRFNNRRNPFLFSAKHPLLFHDVPVHSAIEKELISGTRCRIPRSFEHLSGRRPPHASEPRDLSDVKQSGPTVAPHNSSLARLES